MRAGSEVAAEEFEGQGWTGQGWTLALGGQSVSGLRWDESTAAQIEDGNKSLWLIIKYGC